MTIFLLSEALAFPPPALAEKEGLLAIGGDLSPERLLLAYENGIFPWYGEDEPILWWSPDPRLVLYPDDIVVSRSLRKIIRQKRFRITIDTAFSDVIRNCAGVRLENSESTWIVAEMIAAYERLHLDGFAHSVEAWRNDTLAGGLYGVSLGHAFFGESMFSRVANASKAAFVALVDYINQYDFAFIDCQVPTDHLKRFGAREISRERFLEELDAALSFETVRGPWGLDNMN